MGSRRVVFAGLAGGAFATVSALLLAVASPAATPVLTLEAGNAVVGQPIQATATLSEAPSATGEITFEVFGPGDPTCSGPAATAAAASVSGEGQYLSGEFTPSVAGVYSWSAHYSGDAENEPANSVCSATSTVEKASPVLTGTAGSGTVGTAIDDEVSFSEGFSPSGEVTFSVFAPGDSGCSTPLESFSAQILGGVAKSPGFSPQQTGEFRWTASYPGDANNEPAALGCNAAGQTSSVGKASPSLSGQATSAVLVGQAITDDVELSGGFEAGGELVFRAFGPGDSTCSGAAAYEEAVVVNGPGSYSPAGFPPAPGLYRWTVGYGGDANNEGAQLACNTANQASAVGTVTVTLRASATNGTVGQPVTATATLSEGAIPSGQITFQAFPPSDASCSGAPAFTSTVKVAGNGSYGSGPFVPSRVGSFRWRIAYSGDANHGAASAGCGSATSTIAQAGPVILGWVRKKIVVGRPLRDTAALQGAYAPGGTITFRIFAPGTDGCAKALLANTIAIAGQGPFKSAAFAPPQAGVYRFAVSYSGDAANRAAAESCEAALQAVRVLKRAPKVKPQALITEGKRISILARLSGSFSPSGTIEFRLYRPGDRLCEGKPAFSGRTTVKKNGNYALGEYLAGPHGTYRLLVGYSGDPRNKRYLASCRQAQAIRVG
jgi:hypothetical protein